jgi:hypothetical protein
MTTECALNHVEHTAKILGQLHVPEAKHPKPGLLEELRPAFVALDLFCMLAAVEFDDQPGLKARKVCDEAHDRYLPAEFPAAELAGAQFPPQQLLDVGGRAAQLACCRHFAFR